MSGQLLTVVGVYCALVALLAMLAAAGVPSVPALRAGLVVAQLLLVAQALLDGVTLLRGHRPQDPATHLGYLAVSVVLLPLLGAIPRRRPAEGPGRADHLVAAVAAGVALVLSVRLHTTGRMRCWSPPTRCWPSPPGPGPGAAGHQGRRGAGALRLSAVAALVYLVLAVSLRRRGRWLEVATVAAAAELAGVLVIGTAERLGAVAWPDQTVWSGYGAGYGFVPLVLPVVALVVLRRQAARRVPSAR